jgi:hypothetical protein
MSLHESLHGMMAHDVSACQPSCGPVRGAAGGHVMVHVLAMLDAFFTGSTH